MMKTIIRSLFCYLFIVGNTAALAQSTAAILPQGQTQFLDKNGNPLSAGKVYFYIPSTTTFKTTWQDAAETTPNTNPVGLDVAGRAIIYGEGTYRQIVKDRNNNTIFDAVTASAGTGNTPTAFGDGAAVGSIKPWAGLVPPANYVYAYGQELSRVTYIALFSATTLNQNLSCSSGSPILTGLADTSQIPFAAVLESTCIPAGSRVISKTTTTVTMNNNSSLTTSTTGIFFLYGNGNGSTTFNVPDLRGYVIAGRCNMGGTDCTNLTTAGLGQSPSGTGVIGGDSTKILTTPNLPAYTPVGSISLVTGTNSTPTVNVTNGGSLAQAAPGTKWAGGGTEGVNISVTAALSGAPIFTGNAQTFTGTAQGGTSTPFSIVQPTITLNYIIKILPDISLSTTSVVTSLGSMQGDITCGTWLTCTSNNIAVSVNPAGAATILMNPTSSIGTANLFTIQGLTNQLTPNSSNDFVPFYNAASGTIQKVSVGVLSSSGVAGVSALGGGTGSIGTGSGFVVTSGTLKIPGIVNVTDFGAVCDGVIDDKTAIQNAISSGASVVMIPPRTCLISNGLTGVSNQKISGAGMFLSTIKFSGSPTLAVISYAQSTNIAGFELSDLTLDANNFAISGHGTIDMGTNSGFTISNCSIKRVRFLHTYYYGISYANMSKCYIEDNQILRDSLLYDPVNSAILSNTGATPGVTLSKYNWIRNNYIENFGLGNDNLSDSFVQGNYINSFAYGSGITTGPSSVNIVMTGNVVANGGTGLHDSGTGRSGGYENYAKQSIFSNNIAYNNGGAGIHMNTAYNAIVGNVAWNNATRFAIPACVATPTNPLCIFSGLEAGIAGADSSTRSTWVGNISRDAAGNQKYAFNAADTLPYNFLAANSLWEGRTALVNMGNVATTSYQAFLGQALTTIASWTPSSVANGATVNTSLSLSGVQFGDWVIVSSDGALFGTTLSGQVTAANSVVVVNSNNTGGTVTPVATKLYLTVFKSPISPNW